MTNYKPLEDYLNSIRVSARAILAEKGAIGDDGWEHDAWNVEFSRQGQRAPLRVRYRTGTGHRRKSKFGQSAGAYTIPQEPDVADVLESVILDSNAADETFEEWAGNFGCDSDSIKALDTYLACQKQAVAFRNFFRDGQWSNIKAHIRAREEGQSS